MTLRFPGNTPSKPAAGTPRRLAFGVATVLLLAACGGEGDNEAVAVSPGQALFEANCTECHGERGLGDGVMAASLPVQPPSLLEHLGHHKEDQLVRIIRTGVPPAMPAAPLDDDQVRLVIAYAWTLVPDSLVDGLREMQRMAEMGMDMGMGMGGMGMSVDSSMAGAGMGSGSGMTMDHGGGMPAIAGEPRDSTMTMDTVRR